MYELIEVSFADLTRLYGYIRQGIFKADFSVKGFGYAWVVNARNWDKHERVLDVGAGYSPLPIHIQQTYGCEVWAADDFGISVDDSFWARNTSAHEHIAAHPEVRYLLERLGDPVTSSLPYNYFDAIYSVSTLEHVPGEVMAGVWKHMDALLKPGGEMLHAIDVHFPSNVGLKKVVMALLFDAFYPFIPQRLRLKHCLATPKNYARLVMSELGLRPPDGLDLNVLDFILNPDVLTESYHYGLHRMEKDHVQDYRYQRTGSLLIRLKKA